MTGGSLGLQAGIQASDLILVFKTHKSIQGLMSGKFTIGADASAAAGPVGREAAAATDATLRAEIYSYSRSRGLFAGVSLDGSAMVIDREGYARYYGPPGPGPGQVPSLPPSAARLLEQVARHAVTETAGAAPVAPMAPLPPGTRGADAQNVRRQLADSSVRLASLLDDNWKRYLALPAEIYSGDRPPPAELVNQSLARFNAVAANPQYQTLWQRPEFQETMSLLKRYAASQNGSASLPLPPPPR
jgi:hypothetical protein